MSVESLMSFPITNYILVVHFRDDNWKDSKNVQCCRDPSIVKVVCFSLYIVGMKMNRKNTRSMQRCKHSVLQLLQWTVVWFLLCSNAYSKYSHPSLSERIYICEAKKPYFRGSNQKSMSDVWLITTMKLIFITSLLAVLALAVTGQEESKIE